MKTFLIVVFLVIFLVIAHAVYKKRKKENDAKSEERYKLRLLDIQKNPQNYFVSEGGTKPDPVQEEPEKCNNKYNND